MQSNEILEHAAALLRFARESDAGVVKLAVRDANGKVISVVIAARGEDAVELEAHATKLTDRDSGNVEGIHKLGIQFSSSNKLTEVLLEGNMSTQDVKDLLNIESMPWGKIE